MASTRWGQVVDALTTRMRAVTPTYRSPWSTSSVGAPVYDSLEVGLQENNSLDRYLVIGWAGDPDALRNGGRAGQKFDTMGTNRGRKETGIVTCLAVSQSGRGGEMRDGMVKAVRDDALLIVADVEAALRVPADGPTLGIAAPRLLIEMGERMEFWPFLAEGIGWKVLFDVKYSTAI